jgi:hypothetical protein
VRLGCELRSSRTRVVPLRGEPTMKTGDNTVPGATLNRLLGIDYLSKYRAIAQTSCDAPFTSVCSSSCVQSSCYSVLYLRKGLPALSWKPSSRRQFIVSCEEFLYLVPQDGT